MEKLNLPSQAAGPDLSVPREILQPCSVSRDEDISRILSLGDGCKVKAIQEIDVNPLLIVKGDPVAADASIILG